MYLKHKLVLSILVIISVMWIHNFFYDLYEIKYVSELCDIESKKEAPGKIYTEGFFYDPKFNNRYQFGIYDAINFLYLKRFKFVEVSANDIQSDIKFNTDYNQNKNMWSTFKFTIYSPYIPNETTECKAFESFFNNRRYDFKNYLTKINFPSEHCIKIEIRDKIDSKYKLLKDKSVQVISPKEIPWAKFEVHWKEYKILNLLDNSVETDLRTFSYCTEGDYLTWDARRLCVGGKKNRINCPTSDLKYKFDKLRNHTLIPY